MGYTHFDGVAVQNLMVGDTVVASDAADLNILTGAKDAVSGTIKSAIGLSPTASATSAGVNYHKLLSVGDVTGTTAYGFGDPAKPTTGIMGSFGRTVATSAGVTDTSLDIRAINKLTNVGANNLQGAYVKVKNYTGATVGGNLIGQFIEVVNDGTVSGTTIGLKIGSDGTTLATDILLHNGATIANTDANTLTITEATVNIAGICKATSFTMGSTAITADGAEINQLDGIAGAALAGVAAGYKVARGVSAVTGTLEITSGLATIVSLTAILAEDPSADATIATVVIPTQTGGDAGKATLKVWKPTAADNSAPTAASAAKNVAWIAVGT